MQSLSTLLTELFFKQTRFTPLTKSFALLQYTPFQHLAIHCGIFVCSTLIVLNWGTVVANLIDSDVDGYAVPDISLTTLAAVAWGGVLV
jgi:hypothetical protein